MNGAPLTGFHFATAVAIMSAITLFTRVFPFLFYSSEKKPSALVLYLGRVLPPAIIALLVVYSLKDVVTLARPPYGAPEAIACLLVLLLQQWKRNAMVSIGLGTLAYMAMIQWVF